jgi:ATP-dependent DNA helicase RecQ
MVTQRRLQGSSGGVALRRHRSESLAAIEGYAHAATCRQVLLCRHFAPHDDHPPCGDCDVCSPQEGDSTPVEPSAAADVIELPESALELVVEAVGALRKPVGKASLAKALRGSKAKAITKLGLQALPQHGALQEYEERSLVAAIESLQRAGRLARAGRKYPTVWLPGKPIRAKRAAGARPRRAASLSTELERYRKRMATKLKWKAYMVFQRKAILAIAKARPTTHEQLLLVPGLGPAKVERFGDDILALVEKYGTG